MVRVLCAMVMLAVLWGIAADTGLAQERWPHYPPPSDADPHTIDRGPGGYLAWWKLLLLAVLFLIWVPLADWVNRDSQRLHPRTKMPAEIWNPIVVGVFLLGFLAAITIPLFIVGAAVYLLTTALPLVIYVSTRNSRVPPNQKVLTGDHLRRMLRGERMPELEPLAQDEGPPIEIQATGADRRSIQVNQIRARNTVGYLPLKFLLHESIEKRADRLWLDYTRQAVTLRLQIDGVWHTLPGMDRPTGDALLVSLKHFADLNPAERRQRQSGSFTINAFDHTIDCHVTSQGVPTGERVQIRLLERTILPLTMSQLGMWPEMVRELMVQLKQPGFVVISAPNEGGLSTTWRSVLTDADRMTRDWVAIVDEQEMDSRVENIENHVFDRRRDETPNTMLKTILLKQPEVVVVPDFVKPQVIDTLAQYAVSQNHTVVTRVRAETAAEAVLRVMNQGGSRAMVSDAMRAALCQRLVRRLCDECKQPAVIDPKVIARLGGEPGKKYTIYQQFVPPPPEAQVDERGRPIEIPPCSVCHGIGYIGRIAVFELLLVSDAVRESLRQNPSLATIQKLTASEGHRTLPVQATRLVLAGVTSLAEVQRVFRPPAKKTAPQTGA